MTIFPVLATQCPSERRVSMVMVSSTVYIPSLRKAALVKAHLSVRGILTAELEKTLDEAAANIDPEEVYAEEEKTQHNIRALVNVFKTKVPAEIAPLVHLGATSVDILDTALSMRVRDAVQNVVLPELKNLAFQCKKSAFTKI